jgi:signal transduction histidine kinase
MQRPTSSVTLETWGALVEMRRILPILVITFALLAAQRSFYPDDESLVVGALLCLACVLLAPLSFRLLFPRGIQSPWNAMRLTLYAFLSMGVVKGVGETIPNLLGWHTSFLTFRANMIVSVALFAVGGWGLGRDINFELDLSHMRGRTVELEREAQQAQLLAIRSHLDPHFLFNTLNAIAEWCRQDGAVAERAVLRLAEMLRIVLTGVKAPSWPLAQEIELLRMLWDLHLLRDPNLFTLRLDLPDPLPEMMVPPMVLLPLAENAVKHGPAAGHRGEISLTLRLKGKALHVTVENPGAYRGPREGSEGLPMVERRLELAYAGEAKFFIGGQGPDRTRVEVCLPLHPPAEGRPS